MYEIIKVALYEELMLEQKEFFFGVLIFYSKKSVDYLKMDGVVAKKRKPLKTECCEKFKEGNRCKRCPCFDLLNREMF